jgi:hypothetical protein
MSIKPTGSMTAASCTACSWIANTARSVGTTVVGAATKVAELAATAFRALARYASIALCYAKNSAIAGLNVIKAHPQAAMGGLAVLVLAAAAYAYSQRTAV